LREVGVLFQCALVYRELVKINIAPPVVDKMELWQIAALMGDRASEGDSVPANAPPGSPPSVAPTGTLTGDALLEARVRAAREGRELDVESIAGFTPESMVAQFRQRAVDRRTQ